MNRDGNNISLWQDVQRYLPTSQPSTTTHYDVVIVGGGMTGVMCAFLLQEQGKKCLLVEAYNLGFGTTGGTTAHLNTLMDTPYHTIINNFNLAAARTVSEAASHAISLIEDNVKLFNIDCEFARTEAHLFSQNEDETKELKKIYQSSKDCGLSIEYVADVPIPVAFESAVRIGNQAKFHPLKYLYSMAAQFEKLGGHIWEDCRVKEVNNESGELEINTSRGNIHAGKLIYATHIPPGINILHLRCAPWRSYAIAAKLTSDQYPEGLIYDMKDPYHYYRSQRIGNETYLIAGGCDHKTGEVENTEQRFRSLSAHVERIFNVAEVTHQWSSQFFESADGLPYIGLLPGASDDTYVATGFGGNGMIYSHVAAREISHLIMTGEHFYGNLFSPSRVKPIAGFNNFVSHNADVVKHFIGKWVGIQHLEELADIAPNEGKVVMLEKTPVAIYKDEGGKLNAVSSVCTHMKCNVTWNNSERSWDCPCHGARYAPDGSVITGPASKDLEPVDLKELLGNQVGTAR